MINYSHYTITDSLNSPLFRVHLFSMDGTNKDELKKGRGLKSLSPTQHILCMYLFQYLGINDSN